MLASCEKHLVDYVDYTECWVCAEEKIEELQMFQDVATKAIKSALHLLQKMHAENHAAWDCDVCRTKGILEEVITKAKEGV